MPSSMWVEIMGVVRVALDYNPLTCRKHLYFTVILRLWIKEIKAPFAALLAGFHLDPYYLGNR